MFKVTETDIHQVLHDFGIQASSFTFEELERYHYEKDDPESRQVRLITKVNLQDDRALVLRFKNEDDAPREIIEAQSRFAALLRSHGIETPGIYASEGLYARRYLINGYDVIVTVENFEDGEIKTVDPITAGETGELLARMHNIAEETDAHVQNEVLFDPLAPNDLFDFDAFDKFKEKLLAIDSELYHAIVQKYEWLMSRISIFGNGIRYAVQGDISDCNLYRTRDGRLGVFDFNRCGDNNLFFDAVMQAVFEARLMDYPEDLAGHQEEVILSSFLKGYHHVRPFSGEQKSVFPHLYALISAFWCGDLDHLTKAIKSGDCGAVHKCMEFIYRQEQTVLPMPV